MHEGSGLRTTLDPPALSPMFRLCFSSGSAESVNVADTIDASAESLSLANIKYDKCLGGLQKHFYRAA